MKRRFFGTDGIRGTANQEPITAETALAVAKAAGLHFMRGGHRHKVVIGKDTRLSGYMLEPALTAGFVSVGMDVVMSGPIPTPGVGMLTRSLRADLGVMISASHNPYFDNGIKLFGPDGYKLSDSVEQQIESRIGNVTPEELAASDRLGNATRMEDAVGRYIEFVKGTFPRNLRLDGLKIVIDCANGAAYKLAPTVLYELGAQVVPLAVKPNGFNINEGCGATDTATMQAVVIENKADLGIALDGDADRVILADEKGRVIDGDQVMALIAESWARQGRLSGNAVISTIMSNLGLERYLEGEGIRLIRTPVGDRYVVGKMRDGGYNVGGEQSGHIVLSDYTTTGDGLIAALQVLAVVVERGQAVSGVTNVFQPYPQLLRNVRYNGGSPLDTDAVKQAVSEGESALGQQGRIVIRKSGTEPVIRVMGEGQDEALVKGVVAEICKTIEGAEA